MPILYIGGYGRSGSTVLDQMVAMHFGGISLGEAVYLPRAVQRNASCSCGSYPDACPVWREAVSQLRVQQPALASQSFDEDGLLGLVSSPSALYEMVQRSVFRDLNTTLYCDSSKTCRHAMLRPMALERLFPGHLLFVWLQRPLWDTLTQSLLKGTNQQLESGVTSNFVLIRVVRGLIGYAYANMIAWVYAHLVFRQRSLFIAQRQLRHQPDVVLDRIAAFLDRTAASGVPRLSLVSSYSSTESQISGFHQIAGNRNRHQS